MKVDKINIIALCNFSHPDFGTFAGFLNGLYKDKNYIEVPTVLYACDVCFNVKFDEKLPCQYCRGLKAGRAEDPFENHTHTWTADEPFKCIKCGILQSFLTN